MLAARSHSTAPAVVATTPGARLIDLRRLPAPAPLTRALDAAHALHPGEVLDVLTPLMPYPLLQALAEDGFEVAAERRVDGSACVTVRRPLDGAPRS